MRVLGLMSGGSLDGVDGVLVEIEPGDDRLRAKIVGRAHRRFGARLRSRIELARSNRGLPELICELDRELGDVFGRSALGAIEKFGASIELIGSHGQTLYHLPRSRGSLAIGSPARIAELSDLPVWSDFRARDIALGGEGAPLAPIAHLQFFSHPDLARIVLNIGSIANLTYITPGADSLSDLIAFDTGPGNLFIDLAHRARHKTGFDRNGARARRGAIDPKLLARLKDDPYFRKRPPKSTGPDRFNLGYLSDRGVDLQRGDENLLATLTEFTASTITDAIGFLMRQRARAPDELIVVGGGALNRYLIERLTDLAAGRYRTLLSSELGYDPRDIEGALMALMAYYAEHSIALDLSSITGARAKKVIHGARTPGAFMWASPRG